MLSLLLLAAAISTEPNWPKVEEHSLELLQAYVRIPTVNPPSNTRKAAELYQTELRSHGLEPKLYPTDEATGKTILLVRLPGQDRAKKPLLLMNHFDVVPVDRAAWGAIDPFGAEIKDGMLWGRGTLDMKGVGIMQLTALTLMKDLGIVPPRDIVMLCTPDEESGGESGIRWMIANHMDEINAEYVIDEGGFGSGEALARNKLAFGIAVGEKQLIWLRMKAKGTAGHGSQPIANNANMILLEAIHKALEMPKQDKQNAILEKMLSATGGLADNKFMGAIERNTISLTTMTSGVGNPVKANVIPSQAEATLDCRLLPGVNADEFLSEMKARVNDRRVTFELINQSADAGSSSTTTPIYRAMELALKKHHPDAVVTPMLVPYGTDSVFLRKLGIPAYGFIPMIIDQATLVTMHSDAERIPVAEFFQGLRIYFDVIRSNF